MTLTRSRIHGSTMDTPRHTAKSNNGVIDAQQINKPTRRGRKARGATPRPRTREQQQPQMRPHSPRFLFDPSSSSSRSCLSRPRDEAGTLRRVVVGSILAGSSSSSSSCSCGCWCQPAASSQLPIGDAQPTDWQTSGARRAAAAFTDHSIVWFGLVMSVDKRKSECVCCWRAGTLGNISVRLPQTKYTYVHLVHVYVRDVRAAPLRGQHIRAQARTSGTKLSRVLEYYLSTFFV